jgi:hypothetical protein
MNFRLPKHPLPTSMYNKLLLLLGMAGLLGIAGILFLLTGSRPPTPPVYATVTRASARTSADTTATPKDFLPLLLKLPTTTPTPTSTATHTPTITLTPTPTATATPRVLQFCRNFSGFPLPIPDGEPDGISDSNQVDISGQILDLNLSLRINHTYVSDIWATLRHVETNTTIELIRRAGGFSCSGDNIAAELDDSALVPISDSAACLASQTPAISGDLRPYGLLSAFNNQNIQGSWVLNVSDRSVTDLGYLVEWCLIATLP